MPDLAVTSATYPTTERIRHYVEQALSHNTRKAYANDLAHYRAWGGPVPAQPEVIASYLIHHAESHSIATLQRRLVAISKAHTMQGHPDPVKSELVCLTMRGIRYVHGKPQTQVAPLLKDDLIVMLSHIPDTLKGKRDKALLLLGFCAALRRSELVAIHTKHLEMSSQGITLTISRSKTDQTGQGRKVGIPKGRGRICPVEAIATWKMHLSAFAQESHLHLSTNYQPLFPSITKGGRITGQALSDRAVANIIKHYASKAGLDASRYSGHSLRVGLATSAAQAGISSWVIRKQTGHKSETMLARYIRDGDLFANNASALF